MFLTFLCRDAFNKIHKSANIFLAGLQCSQNRTYNLWIITLRIVTLIVFVLYNNILILFVKCCIIVTILSKKYQHSFNRVRFRSKTWFNQSTIHVTKLVSLRKRNLIRIFVFLKSLIWKIRKRTTNVNLKWYKKRLGKYSWISIQF